MLFLELNLYDGNIQIIINLQSVCALYANKDGEGTWINVGGTFYKVKQDYKEIIDMINNYADLPKP